MPLLVKYFNIVYFVQIKLLIYILKQLKIIFIYYILFVHHLKVLPNQMIRKRGIIKLKMKSNRN